MSYSYYKPYLNSKTTWVKLPQPKSSGFLRPSKTSVLRYQDISSWSKFWSVTSKNYRCSTGLTSGESGGQLTTCFCVSPAIALHFYAVWWGRLPRGNQCICDSSHQTTFFSLLSCRTLMLIFYRQLLTVATQPHTEQDALLRHFTFRTNINVMSNLCSYLRLTFASLCCQCALLLVFLLSATLVYCRCKPLQTGSSQQHM